MLNGEAQVERISLNTFTELAPRAMFILTDDIEQICERNRKKSAVLSDQKFVREFQENEVSYGLEIAWELQIPVRVINFADGISQIKQFLEGCEV